MTISLAGISRESPSLLRVYVFGVGVLLLGQGAVSLIVEATGRDAHETTRLLSDPWHAAIHVVWGVVLLAILATTRDAVVVERAAIVFGVFYLSFLVLGLVVHHPLGLMIDGPENVFHAVIGGLALILGLREMTARRREGAR